MTVLAGIIAVIVFLVMLIAILAIPTLIHVFVTILTFDHILKKHEKRLHEHIQIAIEDALNNRKLGN